MVQRKPVLLLLIKNSLTLVFIKKLLGNQFSLISEKEEEAAFFRMNNTLIDLIILEESFTTSEKLPPLIRSLKKSSSQNWFPFLLLTDQWKKKFREEMIHSGITDFISSTLEEKELQEKLQAAFKTKDLEEKIRDLSSKLPSFKTANLQNHFTYQLSSLPKEKKTEVDLLLVQIDYFEKLEKTIPSLQLERILLMCTQLLYKKTYKYDKLNPLGKGRFLLLLVGRTKKGIQLLGKELQEEIKQIPFPNPEKPLFLSFSVVINHLDEPQNVTKAQSLFQKTLLTNEKLQKKKQKEQIIIP